MKLLMWIAFLFPLFSVSQTVQGFVYDEEIPLEYVLITNLTQDRETFSNKDGAFSIEANENDELLFSTSFFIDKRYSVTKKSFEEIVKINMKPDLNQLEEVVISNYSFDDVKYNADFRQQLLNDIKNNPHLYERPSNGTMDFIKIFKGIGKLFKKKNEAPSKPKYISYPELKALVLERKFNGASLVKMLKIKEAQTPLFIDFCRDKIEEELVKKENELLLLDQFITLSDAFKALNKEN